MSRGTYEDSRPDCTCPECVTLDESVRDDDRRELRAALAEARALLAEWVNEMPWDYDTLLARWPTSHAGRTAAFIRRTSAPGTGASTANTSPGGSGREGEAPEEAG